MSTATAKSTDTSSSTATSQADMLVSQDIFASFTATGHLMSTIKTVQHARRRRLHTPNTAIPPMKFHDEDIIPVPMFVAKSENEVQGSREKNGFMGKMKGLASGLGKEKRDKLRVVYMPQGEHLKYFTKDDEGNYEGTKPQRS